MDRHWQSGACDKCGYEGLVLQRKGQPSYCQTCLGMAVRRVCWLLILLPLVVAITWFWFL